MPKPIVFIAALLLALPAFAQTRMPARQVEADTNMVNIAISLPFTVQAALDWIDANWSALSSESWSNLDPAEDTVQSVFDWVDDNWQAVDDSGWLFLDPESPTTQSVFDWIDLNWRGSGEFLASYSTAASTAFDLENLHAYLLGGTYYTNYFMTVVTNDSGTNYVFRRDENSGVEMSTDGGGENPALVPALQYNQGIYADNFDKINTNTYLTTNLFSSLVLDLLDLSSYAAPPEDDDLVQMSRHEAYTNFVHLASLFEQMGTNITELPEGLDFSFPSLFDSIDNSLKQLSDLVAFSDFPDTFFGVPATGGVFQIDWTNGLAQLVVVTNDNMELSFGEAPLGLSARFEIWLKNSGYTNVQYTGYLDPCTNAVDPGGKTLVTLNRYYASPFSTDWMEERVFPTEYVAPEAPDISTVATVSFTSVSNVTITTNTYTNSGVIYEAYIVAPSAAFGMTGYANLTTAADNTFDYLVVGGGGGGGDSYGGGGGGGVVKYGTMTLLAGTHAITVGAGGARTVAGGMSSFRTIVAEGGAAGSTGGRYGPAGAGGASGSAAGGVAASCGGGGGAAAGTSPGGSGSTGDPSSGKDDRGGNGASGYSSDIRGSWNTYGSGGGGGVWRNSMSYAGNPGAGAGHGGYNGHTGYDATYYGCGGGGGGPGAASDTYGGNGYSGVVILRQAIGVVE
jgi:hypothetical protein